MALHSLLDYGIDLIGKKWTKEIILHLQDGPLRFSQIRYRIPSCSVKVLSEVLNHLEKNAIVHRTQYNEVPLRVTYQLTQSGVTFIDLIKLYKTTVRTHLNGNKELYKNLPTSPNTPNE